MGERVENVVDFIEKYFSRQLDMHLAEDLRSGRITFEHRDLQVAYAAWRQRTKTVPADRDERQRLWTTLSWQHPRGVSNAPAQIPPPRRSPNDLRPYLLAQLNPNSKQFGIYSAWSEDKRWQAVDAIKHHLLYCHTLAIENPMAQWMAEPQGVNSWTHEFLSSHRGLFGWKFNSRPILAGWISFLAHVRPLLNTGVLVLVEEKTRDPITAVEPKTLGCTREEAERQAIKIGLDSWSTLTGALKKLTCMVEARARSGGGLDLELSDPAVARLVGWLAGHGTQVVGTLRADRQTALATLLQADLPSLSRLSIEDLVAVRMDAEEFDKWRGWLQRIAEIVPPEAFAAMPPADHAAAMRERFGRELADRREHLKDELAKSLSLRKRLGQATLKFTMGAIAGAAFAGPVGMIVGIIPTVLEVGRDLAKTIGEALAEHSTEASGEPARVAARRALAGLFVAFEEDTGVKT